MKITLFVIFSVKSTCHYTQEDFDFLEDEPINTVPKNLNPPNAPQIQPIQIYWGALKQMFYAKNWSAKNCDQLIRKIKKCPKEMDSQFMCKCLKISLKKLIWPMKMGFMVYCKSLVIIIQVNF